MADPIEKSANLIIGVPCRTHFEYLASRAVTIELPEDRFDRSICLAAAEYRLFQGI